MKNITCVLGAETKKIFQKKEFLFGLILVFIMGCGMVYGVYEYPDSFGIQNVAAFYGNFSSILILFLAAKVLGEEFDLKTFTFVFSSKCNRGEIYTAKIISVTLCCLIIGMFGGILHNTALILCNQEWDIITIVRNVVYTAGAYALYGYVAAAGAILLTTFVKNTIMPFIYLIILYWVFPGILELVTEKIIVLDKVSNLIAFSFADDFIMYQTYTWQTILVLLLNGTLFYILSLWAVKKRDL